MGSLEDALKALEPNKYANKPPSSIAVDYSTTPQYSVPDWYGQSSGGPTVNVPVAPTGPDPMALLAEIMGQAPPDFNSQARSQLNSVYAPQFAAIDKAKGSANSTKKANQAQLAAMYNALGKDVTAQQGVINGTFNNAKSATGQAYAQGQQGISGANNA